MEDEYDFSQGKRGAIEPISPGRTRARNAMSFRPA